MKHGLIYVYGDITRRDDENRIVEGYCFVNESVGKGKATIARSAMEEATKSYLAWGCVREMHGSNAAGTSNDGERSDLGVTWDDKGAYFRCKVVDDNAWKKVQEGVYKGFSVGVKPIIVRGNNVQKCDWVEVSLVDRPADPDTRCAIARSEDWQGETEFEVTEERGLFADGIDDMEKSALRNAAWYRLDNVLYSIQHGSDTNKAGLVREACREFGDYIAPIISRGEFGTNELFLRIDTIAPDNELLQRAESVEGLTTRAETAEAEVTRLQTAFDQRGTLITRLSEVLSPVEGEDESAMVERAIELLAAPKTKQPPIGVHVTAEGLVKRITDGATEEESTQMQKLIEERTTILNTDWRTKSPEEKQAALMRVEEIKREVARLS